jgi:maltooligosyltrehalose trehalohydrolase
MKDFYRELISLRKGTPALSSPERDKLEAWSAGGILFLKRWKDGNHAMTLFNFSKKDIIIGHGVPDAGWKKMLDSSDRKWNGPGSKLPEVLGPDAEITLRAESLVLYEKDRLTTGD